MMTQDTNTSPSIEILHKDLDPAQRKSIILTIDDLIKKIRELDQRLLEVLGPNDQIFLNWKDSLNEISIDPDLK